MAQDARYNVTLPPQLDEDLKKLEENLGTSKAEILRRALVLYKHAVAADEVEFTRSGKKQTVLVK
jgi:predicted DNA-binding protein